jgi:hypothetical protein
MVTSSGTEINMALDFGLGYKTFTYNLVKHIDIFFIKNLVWATSLNFPISIPAYTKFIVFVYFGKF